MANFEVLESAFSPVDQLGATITASLFELPQDVADNAANLLNWDNAMTDGFDS